MKKWYILAALALLLFTRAETTDISQLEPVSAVQILNTQDGVRVLTDTGAKGYGSTLARALENLHSSAPNQIFLDTAQYLFIDNERNLEELYPIMRPACQVCLAREETDLEMAAQYLRLHGPKITLIQCRAERTELPILYSKEGRSQLVY